MIRIGICDDEKQFMLELRTQLLKYASDNHTDVKIELFVHPIELFSNMEAEGPLDLLFLDIELEEDSGINVGQRIRSDMKNEMMQIVFISAKESYAMQLFDIRPMNFLVKPVTYGRVEYIMKEYERLFYCRNALFRYKIGRSEYQISEQHIQYFQSIGKKIQMVTLDGIINFYEKLSNLVPRLASDHFCRIHKSYVVNMSYIKEYRKDCMIMVNGDRVPVSRSMRKQVNEKVMRMMNGGDTGHETFRIDF